MITLRSATLFCFLTLTLTLSHARDLAFQQSGGLKPTQTDGGFFSAWNPTASNELLAPGVKIVFFGSASACDFQTSAGPTSSDSRYSVRELANYTGLAPDIEIRKELITPIADPKHCKFDRGKHRDGSFVIRGSKHGDRGIGLFTTVGPDANGRRPLVDIFDSKGQGGSGANASIGGSFVIFRFDWENSASATLWRKMADKQAQQAAVLDIETTQTLATASLGNTPGGPSAPVKQAKQQLTVTLINRACRHESSNSARLCQMQYLFTLGVVRSGVRDWNKVDWFQVGRLWIDPAQGNMPVLDGLIRAKGQVTQDVTRKLDLYTSDGAETAHDTFADRSFRVRLEFEQFQNALRLATATQMKKSPQAVSSDDLARAFGPQWNDPTAWTLLDVEVGQEIYNANPDSEAHIGGSFREITVGAAATN